MTSPHEDLWVAKAEQFAASGEGKFLREWAAHSAQDAAARGVHCRSLVLRNRRLRSLDLHLDMDPVRTGPGIVDGGRVDEGRPGAAANGRVPGTRLGSLMSPRTDTAI